MSRPVRVFKPDQSSLIVFRAMACCGGLGALIGFVSHAAIISCVGLTFLTVFLALSFKQTSEAIEFYDDRIVFRHAGIAIWTLPYIGLGGIELATTEKYATKYSPGRTILLRFMDSDNKLSAEANVNAYEKTAIKSMIELVQMYNRDLILNSQALALLQSVRNTGSPNTRAIKTE